MKQKGVFTNWRQTLIYSIEQDMAAEYEADKIVFDSRCVKSLLLEFKNSESAFIYGFYGCCKDIEKEIRVAHPDIEPLIFEETYQEQTRGKIVLVQSHHAIIPCLILPESFFLKKPIDEKSIELTLFRILQDITHTVIACLNDNILSEWYKVTTIIRNSHNTNLREKKVGNPFFDIIRGSQVKYGPTSPFLAHKQTQKIQIYIQNQRAKEKEISLYLNQIQIHETCIVDFQFNLNEYLAQQTEESEQEVNSFLRFTYTRVPLQFCTIENNTLTPLIDGFRQNNESNQSLTVPQRARLLALGYIEDYLMNLNEKIYVISIIGRQSSGKSYILNRLFGTRFTVAASRCTDGIWASIVEINETKFLILDCEGLFSPQRTKSEETYLLAFLAGICDVTILNQDLSFNRHLDELLDNLTNAIGRLTGDSLFKGTLLIALRDITQKDSAGAQEQLLKNIGAKVRSRNSSFLNTLFSDSFNIYLFSHFEHKDFPKEIEDVREKFMQFADKSNRWSTGKDLIQTIKILLIQLQTQDDENTDDLHFRFQIDNVMDKLKRNWNELEEDLKFIFMDKEISNQQYVLWSETHEQKDFIKFWENLIQLIIRDLQLDQQVLNHNSNMFLVQQFINLLLTQRKSYISNQYDVEIRTFIKSEIEIEFVKHQRTILMRYLDEQEQLYQICSMQCSNCFLSCSKMQNHSNYWQSQINQKDNKLQNILKKFENKSTNLEDNEQQIDLQKQQEIELRITVEQLEKSIYYFQEYNKYIVYYNNMREAQNQLKNHTLSDDLNFHQVNFSKLLSFYQNLNLLKIKDTDLIFIESGKDEVLQVKQLYLFIETTLKKFEFEQSKLQKKLENVQKDLKKTQESITQLNLSRPKDQQQRKNLLQQIEQSDKQLEYTDSEIRIQYEKTQDLQTEHSNFLSTLKSLNLIQGEENQNSTVDEMKKSESFIKQKINKLDQQLKYLNDEINQMNLQLENPEQKRQEFSNCLLNKLNLVSEEQFLIESQQAAEDYNRIKQELQELHELDLELNSNNKLRKNFNLEIKKIQQKLKVLNGLPFKSLEDIIKELKRKKGLSQQKLQQLKEQDIELMVEIFKTQNLSEEISFKFKDAYVTKKLEEWEFEMADERLQKQVKLEDLQIQQKMSQQYAQESEKQLEFIQFTIKFRIELNKLLSLQKKQSNEKQQQIKQQDQLTSLNKKIDQQDQDLTQLAKNELGLVSEKTTYEDTLKIYEEKIKKIKERNESFEIFEGFVAHYKNLQKDIEKQDNILQDWVEYSKINDSSLCEQNIQEIINSKINQLEDIQQQQILNKQQIELLKGENRDLLQIQLLQFQLDELKREEKEQHSCLRKTHLCDQQCVVCKDTFCTKIAGHQQDHLCDLPKHYCTQFCSIKLCDQTCRKLYLHDGQHTCENPHYCKLPCQFCGADCQFEQQVEHTDHFCSLRGCIQKCGLCARSCLQEHSHSRLEGNVHFCENIHSCSQECTQPGVCVWEYLEEKREWKSSITSFEYTYFKLIDGGKQSCTISIEPNQITHGDVHSCKTEAHRCGAKCPECDGLCTKPYGHEGLHFAKLHRNKDSQVFTLNLGQGKDVQFGDNLEICKYQVGDSSCPETCSESCTRRSRAHFHLMQCDGDEKCLEKSNQFARHQKEFYQGFEDVEFDEIQCVEYWRLQQWEHPLYEGDKLANVQGCNYFCPYCPSNNKKYCKLPAWHSFSKKYEDHEFWCYEEHQETQFIGLDLAFVIDTTGSMSSMIEGAKEMVIQIMKQAKLSAGKNIRFGIVAYRDHPPEDVTYVTKVQELGNEIQALKFLGKLTAEGGGDYPEAVLDGLQEAVKLSWSNDHDKMIFLIGDAPPHGKKYSNQGAWPEGCPCGIRESSLFRQMQFLQIQFKILALNSGLNQMIRKFEEYIDLEVLQEIEGINFVSQVVAKVCQQIEMREITYRKK